MGRIRLYLFEESLAIHRIVETESNKSSLTIRGVIAAREKRGTYWQAREWRSLALDSESGLMTRCTRRRVVLKWVITAVLSALFDL